MQLTLDLATSLAELPLRCICREYPTKLDHVINGEEDVVPPRTLHPSFYGCFDWHSSVHGHWMLVHILRNFDVPSAPLIRSMVGENLSKENLAAEAAYLDQPNRESFERTYGWAWLLKLAHELHGWDDPDGRQWAQSLQPLEDKIVEAYLKFLPKQTYPIRSGLHSNTAFGLTFAFDYANAVGRRDLADLIIERATAYFGHDEGFSAQSEPSGSDFLSPTLIEADLMRRILPAPNFAAWFKAFLPDPSPVLNPVTVTDRTDPQLAHLDGLNLSRSWCLEGIGQALHSPQLLHAADSHTGVGLQNVETGDYAGEHWLASFAVYMLSKG